MNHSMRQRLVRWAILALGVALATRIVPGITCDDVVALLIVVLLLSFFNTILKPVLLLFTLPFIIVTMGLGIIVINACLFLLAAELVQGFDVQGFWPAVGGSIVVSITNFVVSRFVGNATPAPRRTPSPRAPEAPVDSVPPGAARRTRRTPNKSDDVIDI